MQFESDFRFDMDDSFSMCSQAMSCPSTGTSFSSASSAYDPFTPTSRRSTPNELTLDFDGAACNSYATAHPGEMTPVSNNGSSHTHANMSKYMFGSVKAEPEQMPFPNSLPSTPLRKMDGMATPDYDHMLDMNLASQHMGSVTPSGPYPMYAISPHTTMPPGPFMMTPTHSLSGSDMADSSSTWSCANDSPISFFPQQQKGLAPHELEALEMERQSQSPLDRFHLAGPPSPGRLRAHRKLMVHEIQRKSTELQRAQIRASRKVAGHGDGAAVDVVRRAMCKCDYPGCHKAFRRNEHLKRHKQT